MVCHVVHLFFCVVKLDGLTTFFVTAGAGFLFIAWPLHGLLGILFLGYFALFSRFPGGMQQAYFSSSQPIAQIACISCLALASAALPGVGRRGGFFSLWFTVMTGTVGIFPNWSFRSLSIFIYFFNDLHFFEHVACSLVAIHFILPALYIGLFCPPVQDGVWDNLVEFLKLHINGGT